MVVKTLQWNTEQASKGIFSQHPWLNKHKLKITWKVLEAPPQLNLRQRLTLLSFSRISKLPSFHLVVPRSRLVKRILTAPPLESLGIMVAMALLSSWCTLEAGTCDETNPKQEGKLSLLWQYNSSVSRLHRADYKCHALTISSLLLLHGEITLTMRKKSLLQPQKTCSFLV